MVQIPEENMNKKFLILFCFTELFLAMKPCINPTNCCGFTHSWVNSIYSNKTSKHFVAAITNHSPASHDRTEGERGYL
jgi:hypothetical protein